MRLFAASLLALSSPAPLATVTMQLLLGNPPTIHKVEGQTCSLRTLPFPLTPNPRQMA